MHKRLKVDDSGHTVSMNSAEKTPASEEEVAAPPPREEAAAAAAGAATAAAAATSAEAGAGATAAKGGEEAATSGGGAGVCLETVVVGYALRDKRAKSFITSELLKHGEERGVSFIRLDPGVPLEHQGPFHLLLHKLDSEEWAKNLKSFARTHPNVVIVDDYDNVHKLDDRRQMLEAVEKLDPKELGAEVLVPKQLMWEAGTTPSDILNLIQKVDFKLPAVAKPIEANGTTSSHSISLAINTSVLLQVEPPVVLQEFVNHGGILFKLYLLGDKVMVFRRNSLPDITPDQKTEEETPAPEDPAQDTPAASEALVAPQEGKVVTQRGGLVQLNRISNVHMSAEEMMDDRVTDPPPELMQRLGLRLKQLLGLHAFNVDILREDGHGDRYFIVDINYMPGYERMPDFPQIFIDFALTRVAARKASLEAEGSSLEADGLMLEELQEPVDTPSHPYPPLQGKKKWVFFRAAMKLCGLEQRSRRLGKDDETS